MTGWLADLLLVASTGLHLASVWCKDRAMDLLVWRGRRRVQRERRR